MSFLKDNANKIVSEIKVCPDYFYNNRMYIRVLNDNLKEVLVEEVYSNIKSKTNRRDKASQSININILKKIVNKLSQIYNFEVKRTPSTNQDLFDYYKKIIVPDTQMHRGNRLYNATKSVLMEIYLDSKNNIKWRPISNDKYFLWTDDVIEPNIAKVVVKIIDTITYKCMETQNDITADLYFMYTDTEFLAIDSTGKIHEQYMPNRDTLDYGKNPFGFLQFVHINQDIENVMPTKDTDTLSTILQINDILTDAKVATYYQANPLVVATNIDVKKSTLNRNPDSVIILNSKAGSTDTPDIKIIPSALQTDSATSLSKEILSMLLDTKGLVVKEGSASVNKSGLSQMIENTDTTEVRKNQIQDFTPAEEELWEKTARMHNWLIDNKISKLSNKTPKKKFDDNFYVELEFETPSTILEEKKELGDNNGDSAEE